MWVCIPILKTNWAVVKGAFTAGLYSLLSKKEAAMLACKEFATGTYSDTIPALRTFQIWENTIVNGLERVFCETTL